MPNIVSVTEPINGKDYHIATQGTQVKADAQGEQGNHTHFRIRVFRVGDSTPVFNQRSDFRDDLNCEAIGNGFTVSEGGYYFYVDSPQGTPSPTVAGVFVVTP